MPPAFPHIDAHRSSSTHAQSYRNPFAPVGKEKHWRSFKAADELALILRYQQGDQGAGGELVRVHRRLLYAIARMYFHPTLDSAELVQVSAIGFLKGVAHYDANKARGGRLVPYARWWARAEVATFAFESRRFIRFARAVEQALTFILNHGPDNPKSREYLRSAAIRDALLVEERVMSLDATAAEMVEGDREEGVHPLEAFLASVDEGPEARVSFMEETKRNAVAVHAGLVTLSERQRVVLHLRCMTDPPSTLVEVGHILGLSAERVRAIQHQALRKMGEHMARTERAQRPKR